MSRGVLIAAVLLAALAGGVYWSEKTKKTDADTPAKDASPKLVTIPEDQAKAIEIKRKDEEPVVADRSKDGKWELKSPKQVALDQSAAGGVVSSMSGLTWTRLVDEKAQDLVGYGLQDPTVRVTVTGKDGKSQTVLIGDETPSSGNFFAKLERDPRVFTVSSANKDSLSKTWKDLRDKRLLTFAEDKLSRVELAAKGQSVEFGKIGQGEWTIVKPKPLRADGFHVEELVRKLKDAQMDASVSDADAKKAAAEFAGGSQVGVAKVTDNAGTQQIEVRKKGDNYYARSSGVEGVHKVSNDIGEALNKGLDDFRNKKLFDFGFSDPGKVEIKDGAKTYTFAKSGDKWMANGKQMDSTSVQNLIDKLRDLQSIKFVEKGFTAPFLELTVTSNDGKRVEKVLVSKTGNSYFAKRDNEPSIYELDSKVVEEIQKAASDVKAPPPPSAAKK